MDVVAIAEDWGGHVIRSAPVPQKMCDQSEYLKVRYVTRVKKRSNGTVAYIPNFPGFWVL